GLRAADPRHAARRRNPVHARGRGGRAVGARRRDRRRVEARPARLSELRGRHMGAAVRGRAAETGRKVVAETLTWKGEGVALAEVERQLAALRQQELQGGAPVL